MSTTPKATPVVPFPSPKNSASDALPGNQLRAPILVVAAGLELEHEAGTLSIGRDTDSNVVLADPLVSRRHARLVVDEGERVILEDLNSANGVFVNGCRLSRPSVLLGEGDRVLIGTTEISVFSMRASAQVRLGRMVANMPRAVEESPPPVGGHLYSTVRSEPPIPRAPKRTIAVTGRSDAINMVGQFAEQLMISGHPVEAARVLSEHLQNLLKGASAGLNVPVRILETATRYALRLHEWTKRIAWVEYVLELHLAAHQVPTRTSLDELQAALGTKVKLDTNLVRYFVTTIESRVDSLTEDERSRLARIQTLEE